MNKPIFSLKEATVTVPNGTTIMDHLNFDIYPEDFITVLGTNGAGKSTLFNVISGDLPLTSGTVEHNGKDITAVPAVKRTAFLARVFQDPKLGTAPRMTVAENLLLAEKRGSRRTLKSRQLTTKKLEKYYELTKTMGNNLEDRLQTATGSLSGGQRQALSFLMATQVKPGLLLLDEHTAALDPKTSDQLMAATNHQVKDNHLTALMITHNLQDALTYGNRLIVLNAGQIILDVRDEEKDALTETDLLRYFTR